MLQKFLFIGLGGSGGKTVRVLRAELERRLEEAGYDGGLPKAWQFLHVDVPVKPDGDDPALPPQLPADAYVGMARSGLSYHDIDTILTGTRPLALEHAAGWRPDPALVGVSPATGAGQFRAVGRVIAGAAMEHVVTRLRAAVSTLSQIDVDAELDRVSRALGDTQRTPTRPVAVVISSLAGGSGAGCFLDVCDALRLMGEPWTKESVGVLFTPDVFKDVPLGNRQGVNANALASTVELLAGYWDNTSVGRSEFAFLEGAALAPAPVRQRGVRYPFLVGMANSKVSFARQNDAYTAVARSLASWVAGAEVSDRIRTSVIGNWSQNATGDKMADRMGFTAAHHERPVNSLGFASVSLGRDRFGRYATERLAGHAVERLLYGHRALVVSEDEGDEAVLDRLANDYLFGFLSDAGLNEAGQENNQVLDGIRGGTVVVRTDELRRLTNKMVSDVTAGRPALDARTWQSIVQGRLKEEEVGYLVEQEATHRKNAAAWIPVVQQSAARATADIMAKLGAPAAARVVEVAAQHLLNVVVPELREDADRFRRRAATASQQVASTFLPFQSAQKIEPVNPVIEQAVKHGLVGYSDLAESHLNSLTASLLADLVDGFLRPLRAAVDRGRSRLDTDSRSTPEHPSPVDRWRSAYVPLDLEPAENEVLLEPTSGYAAALDRLLCRTTEIADPGGARNKAVRESIVSASDERAQTLIDLANAWSPNPRVLTTEAGAQQAAFEVHLEADDVLRRARGWVRRPDTPLGAEIAESLMAYLDAKTVDPAVHDKRLVTFRNALLQALDTSKPFVSVDPAACMRVHNVAEPKSTHVLSNLPFPAGHPAREVVTAALLAEGMDEPQIAKLFREGVESRIEITAFFENSLSPFALENVIDPVAEELAQRAGTRDNGSFWQWRRCRPLPEAIPVPPEARLAMIRGWFVARALGYVDATDPRERAVTVWAPDGVLAFPFPVLGKPVVQPADALAAMLESLPLAMLRAARNGDPLLAPYLRIQALGRPTEGTDIGTSRLTPELEAWVASGTSLPGAPAPTLQGADRNARLDALHAFFEDTLTFVGTLQAQRLDRDAALRVSRTWELRDDYAQCLRELQDVIARSRDIPPNPTIAL